MVRHQSSIVHSQLKHPHVRRLMLAPPVPGHISPNYHLTIHKQADTLVAGATASTRPPREYGAAGMRVRMCVRW